jgi:hypothetical protein
MDHLDADVLSAYIDGRLFGPQRGKVERHLSICADCSRRLSEAARAVARLGFDRPAIPHHTLEEALTYLQAILPLPFWVLNLLLYLLTYGLIGLLPSLRQYWWGKWPYCQFTFFAETLVACYFFVILSQLRALVLAIGRMSKSHAVLKSFIQRYVNPLYGWITVPIGKLTLSVTSWQTTLLFYVTGYILWIVSVTKSFVLPELAVLMYLMLIKSVWMLTTPFYLVFLVGLAGVLKSMAPFPASAESEVLRVRLRAFIQRTTLVTAIAAMAWIWGTEAKGESLVIWGPVVSIFLLVVIFCHLYYERRFFSNDLPKPVNIPGLVEASTTAVVILVACGPGILSLIS